MSTSLLNINLVALSQWKVQTTAKGNYYNNMHSSSAFNVLPSGLRCLQRNFPSNRNSLVYFNFSIKCGGPQIRSTIRLFTRGITRLWVQLHIMLLVCIISSNCI